MIINIGDTIEHGGMKFMVTDMRMSETVEGKTLEIRAYDPDTANQQQQKQIEVSGMQDTMLQLFRKLMERGGSGGI